MAIAEGSELTAERRSARKLQTFVFDYGLSETAALVVQAFPEDAELEVNLADASMRVVLAQGGSDGSNSWWNGLQSSASTLRGSVDGLASVSGASPPIWASELHTDGHLIAGVWDFYVSGEVRLITWDYAALFDDFGRLAENVASTAFDEGCGWLTTATLLRSDTVHYGSESNRRTNRLNPPLGRPNLEFRLRRCVGPQGLRLAVDLMRRDFRRAYGEPF